MAVDETEQGSQSPQDARLDSLEERLGRAQATEDKRTGRVTKTANAGDQLGSHVLSTLLGGLLGGALIGWLLDKWLGTGHALLVVMMVLGTVGGFWSIFKLVNRKP